jgi:hypothetical protein
VKHTKKMHEKRKHKQKQKAQKAHKHGHHHGHHHGGATIDGKAAPTIPDGERP